jgi:hypothetical protein
MTGPEFSRYTDYNIPAAPPQDQTGFKKIKRATIVTTNQRFSVAFP